MPPTKVFYQDKTLTVGEDEIDGRGVQVILQDNHNVGAEIVTGGDYYVLRKDGKWWAVDQNGLYDFLLDSGIVLFGRTITSDEYNRVMKQAFEDRKLSWLMTERQA